eukprot:363193-Chlamydomonas_euryale.AAC.13
MWSCKSNITGSQGRPTPARAVVLDELLGGKAAEAPHGKQTVASPPAKNSKEAKNNGKVAKSTSTMVKSSDKGKASKALDKKRSRAKQQKKPVDEDEDEDDEDDDDSEEQAPRRKPRQGRRESHALDDDDNNDEDDDDNDTVPRKSAPGPRKAYSKRVEKLRTICKQATITIPPGVYAKNSGSEGDLVRALGQLLEKHELCPTSSASEIQAVRKQIQTQKDLDGIDMSNIISTGGRRPRRAAAASISFKPPKYDDSDEDDESEEEEYTSGSSDADDNGSRQKMSKEASTSAKKSTSRKKPAAKHKRQLESDGSDGAQDSDDIEDEDEEACIDDGDANVQDTAVKGKRKQVEVIDEPKDEDRHEDNEIDDKVTGKVAAPAKRRAVIDMDDDDEE